MSILDTLDKVPLMENRTLGVIPTSRLGGGGVGAHFIVSAPGAENPIYATV